MILGSSESEYSRLTNGEIIFEEFQPMSSQSINVTERQTDGQTTCDRKTALCTVGLSGGMYKYRRNHRNYRNYIGIS